jgi:hypothetical protein
MTHNNSTDARGMAGRVSDWYGFLIARDTEREVLPIVRELEAAELERVR